jgi:single-stranded-DNA-specific exonuclease
MDVIVCDHHQCPATRPPAFAVLNPVVRDAGFPFPGLCAAGVVFYLLMGTRMHLRETGAAIPDLRRYLDLAALGTVADLVPLVEENRVFVKYGLKEIGRSRRIGLRALVDVCGGGLPSVEMLGFRLGPRLNASGRLADATRAVELLTCEDPAQARRLAEELDGHNRDRRGIEEATFLEAEAMIAGLDATGPRKSYVLASEGWHAGVVGIVASRLVDRHFRPVVLLALEGKRARGSARGIPSVHLFEMLQGCSSLLERFGGHRMAAGLSLRCEDVGPFTERFEQVIAAGTADEAFVPELRIDAPLRLDDVTNETLEDLDRLEPCGQQNPRPCFLAEGVHVVESRVVGERHLKLALRGSGAGRTFHAIAFRRGDQLMPSGSVIDLVFSPEIDHWEGRERLQLNVRDFRKIQGKTAS